MNCPKCFDTPEGEYLAATDQLWCEFDAQIFDGYLHTAFYCRRCDWSQQNRFDPEVIHMEEEE